METNATKRKATPIYSGFLAYFPDAIAEVARHSYESNEQHNPGTAMHWDRTKSADELDALARHLTDNAKEESIEHLRAVAWRAMAQLQKAIERGRKKNPYLIIEDTRTGERTEVYNVPGTVDEKQNSKTQKFDAENVLRQEHGSKGWRPPTPSEIVAYIESLNK